MIRVKNLSFEPFYTKKDLYTRVKEVFSCSESDILSLSISSKSLDARLNKKLCFVIGLDVELKNEEKYALNAKGEIIYPFVKKEYVFPTVTKKTSFRPVVVGFGPAGIFCSLLLAECGYKPIIIERGEEMEKREEKVAAFNATGALDTESNIQFGEGGAGAFSDGKLTTLIKDKDNRCAFVLKEFVSAGAPEEILYLSHPHIGTDLLRNVIITLRERIKKLGGSFCFSSRLTDIETDGKRVISAIVDGNRRIETDSVFLCIGHSSRDTFEMLSSKGIETEQKPFSVGVRIEHLQKNINKARYHEHASSPYLPNAEYKAVAHTPNGRALYTFCMCPGGRVVAATSEKGCVVTNGMSYHSRDGENSNSALLVSVEKADIGGSLPLDGVKFQRKIERASYEAGGGDYKAPAQTVGDFLKHKETSSFGGVEPTYPRGVTGCDLHGVLPEFVCKTLEEGIILMNKQIPGFAADDAVLTGVESRSTCPIRFVRDSITMQTKIKGLYPAGEGAGYAGGIMSAASDGLKVAEAYIADRGTE